jgi:hypothetical protein
MPKPSNIRVEKKSTRVRRSPSVRSVAITIYIDEKAARKLAAEITRKWGP